MNETATEETTESPDDGCTVEEHVDYSDVGGRIAPQHVKDWFTDTLERDPDVCNNCFGRRERDAREFYRSVGTNTTRTDRFCDCGAGTGDDPVRHAPGTVEREWSESSPLVEHGARVSFAGVLHAAADRLEDRGYNVDRQFAKLLGGDSEYLADDEPSLKNLHPSQDREVIALILWHATESEPSGWADADAVPDVDDEQSWTYLSEAD